MAGGVALLGLLLSYALGFSAGAARTEARLAAEGEQGTAPSGGQATTIVDPLQRRVLEPAQPGSPSAGTGGGLSGAAGSAERASGGAAGRSADGQPATPAAGDPREPGKYYFVLAHASVEKARRAMIDFLRTNGLDARVVRDHNGTLRKVIVLPGFPSKSASLSPELSRVREMIREVGFKWARQSSGNRDFGDAYLEQYRP